MAVGFPGACTTPLVSRHLATIRDLSRRSADSRELSADSSTGRIDQDSSTTNRGHSGTIRDLLVGHLETELRHTAASLMIRAGADPKVIQTQLSHASIAITYDLYGHRFPDRLDELASKLDELIQNDGPKRHLDGGLDSRCTPIGFTLSS